MTEGPEASYLANYISKRFLKKRLRSIKIVAGRYKTHGPPHGFREFTQLLPVRLVDVYKKGKVIFLFFENGWCLVAKMGMVGWFYSEADRPNRKGDSHVEFVFENNSLIFSDFRNFGTLEFTNDSAKVIHEIESVAPDILDPNVNFSQIQKRAEFLDENSKLDELLMDQEALFSGIGNIIKSEALYSAKISPHRTLGSLTSRELANLWKSVRSYARHILKILESEEIHSPAYVALQKIYQRTKDPGGHAIKSYKSVDGRTTFWVPAIQK
jgi:formamidopyrimidine-DNA glycosylase